MFWFYSEVGAYLGRVLGIETQLEQSQCDLLADPILQHDQLDLAFICGLPFVQYQRVTPTQLEALVAPVMQAERYQNRPVYFSEVIVKADRNFKTFSNLLGKTLCFNDPGSNSGYNLLRHRLIQGKYPSHFFLQSYSIRLPSTVYSIGYRGVSRLFRDRQYRIRGGITYSR